MFLEILWVAPLFFMVMCRLLKVLRASSKKESFSCVLFAKEKSSSSQNSSRALSRKKINSLVYRSPRKICCFSSLEKVSLMSGFSPLFIRQPTPYGISYFHFLISADIWKVHMWWLTWRFYKMQPCVLLGK